MTIEERWDRVERVITKLQEFTPIAVRALLHSGYGNPIPAGQVCPTCGGGRPSHVSAHAPDCAGVLALAKVAEIEEAIDGE